MLKKKNMAIMMAVATVATTAAPAFAAVEAQNVDEAKLIADVTAKLNTKYSDRKETGEVDKLTDVTEENAYRNSVYKIEAGYDKQAQTEVTNIKDFKKTIEEAKLNEAKLNVTITDKGHKEVDGKIVATENTKYTYYTQNNLNDLVALAGNNAITRVELNEDNNAVLTLKNKSEIVLSTTDYVLDLDAAVDANGNAIDLKTANEDVLKRVVGFKKVEAAKADDIDLPSKVESKLVFDAAKAVTKVEAQYSELVTNEGYTKQGKEVVDTLREAAGLKDDDHVAGADVVRNGKKYNVTTNLDDAKLEAVKGAGYQLVYKLTVKDGEKTSTVNYVVVDNNQKHLADLKKMVADSNVDITEGRYTKLAGEDRFKTAIEVSKKSFDADKAEGIVLVGENAIVDGLASAPLAAQKKAPILLTNKDALSVETIAEMKRATKENPTVYIVGGESVISKEVEKQLITELNAHIVRVAGEDRHATSLEIAKQMIGKDAKISNGFVVGGEGEADAMSIASIAAAKNAPIIVSPVDGLTKDAKKLLDDTNGKYTVIGGTSKVSTQVLKDVRAFDPTTQRIAGSDRHETNADVITTYVKDAKAVYVAKDGYAEGNGQLIDALAVAPLAARTEAPIVLATSDLTKEQTKALETIKEDTNKRPLTQAGNGVTTTVTQKLLKLLGL